MGLSFRVRDGTGRFPHAITTENPTPPKHACRVWWETIVFPGLVDRYSITNPNHHHDKYCGGVVLVGCQPHSEREQQLFDDLLYVISLRFISTGQLHALQRFHTRLSTSRLLGTSHPKKGLGNLISEQASRLDAFSGYLFRT